MKASTLAIIAGVTLSTAVAGYALLFDYRRRHSTAFRRQLDKEAKKQQRAKAQGQADAQAQADKQTYEAVVAEVRQVRTAIEAGTFPPPAEQLESYLLSQAEEGERLAREGDNSNLPAAAAFFRIVRIHPQPFEVLLGLAEAVPSAVHDLILKLIEVDTQLDAAEGKPVPKQTAPADATPQDSDELARSADSQGSWDVVSDPEPSAAFPAPAATAPRSKPELEPESEPEPEPEPILGKDFGAAAPAAAHGAAAAPTPIHFGFGSSSALPEEQEVNGP